MFFAASRVIVEHPESCRISFGQLRDRTQGIRHHIIGRERDAARGSDGVVGGSNVDGGGGDGGSGSDDGDAGDGSSGKGAGGGAVGGRVGGGASGGGGNGGGILIGLITQIVRTGTRYDIN